VRVKGRSLNISVVGVEILYVVGIGLSDEERAGDQALIRVISISGTIHNRFLFFSKGRTTELDRTLAVLRRRNLAGLKWMAERRSERSRSTFVL
jgi:hypothetical protein